MGAGILLACGKNLQKCTISLKGGYCSGCTKSVKWAVMYLCVRGIDFQDFDFGIVPSVTSVLFFFFFGYGKPSTYWCLLSGACLVKCFQIYTHFRNIVFVWYNCYYHFIFFSYILSVLTIFLLILDFTIFYFLFLQFIKIKTWFLLFFCLFFILLLIIFYWLSTDFCHLTMLKEMIK